MGLHEMRKIRFEFELWTVTVQKNARHQHAVAVARQRVRHGREDARMPRQGQIVVAAQVQGFRAGGAAVQDMPSSPGIPHALAVVALDAHGQKIG